MTGRRDLKLESRQENTREKKFEIIAFSLQEIKDHFDENLQHIRQQYDVAQALIESGKQVDGENIWRSQIMFLDSAFDFYLHELTKYGLGKEFEGEWEKTDRYNNLMVKMPYIERALDDPDDNSWFTDYINSEFSRTAMMSYEIVKRQLNLLGIDIKKAADKAFYCRGADEKTGDKLKRRINELYSRRNLIAHQSDRKAHNAEREDISKEVVESFVNDIERIVDAIHKVALEK